MSNSNRYITTKRVKKQKKLCQEITLVQSSQKIDSSVSSINAISSVQNPIVIQELESLAKKMCEIFNAFLTENKKTPNVVLNKHANVYVNNGSCRCVFILDLSDADSSIEMISFYTPFQEFINQNQIYEI